MREDGFHAVTVIGGGIGLDCENLIDSTLSMLAFNVDKQVD
jgi:hypothetical protein